jgi:diguanylate cyclase (GGDEF)-like protein
MDKFSFLQAFTRWWTYIKSSKYRHIPPIHISYQLILKTGITTALVIVAIKQLGYLQGFDLKIFDQFTRWHSQPQMDDRLLVVGITEQDLQKLQEWPISDLVLAQIFAKLQKSQPAVIGLDIYRNFPQKFGQEQLIKQLQAPNVVIIEKLGNSITPDVPPPDGIKPAQIGFSDLLLDIDGVVRRHSVFGSASGKSFYSFPWQMANLYLKKQGITPKTVRQDRPEDIQLGAGILTPMKSNDGGYVHMDDRGYQILINYRHRQIANTVSLQELLNDQVDDSLIKNKIVLVGTNAVSLKDSFFTPFSPTELDQVKTPGVMIHAQVVSQLLNLALAKNHELFRFLPEQFEIFLVFLGALIGGIIAWRITYPFQLVLILAIANIILWTISFYLFIYGVWLSVLPMSLSFIITSVGIILYKQIYHIFYDRLTGLPNRTLFLNRLDKAIRHLRVFQRTHPQGNNQFGVIFMDLDRFQVIHNSLGHTAGDLLLVAMVNRLKKSLRKQDVIARLGNDEFGILIKNLTGTNTLNTDNVVKVAERIQQSLLDPFQIADHELFINASIGIALSEKTALEPEHILRNAHTAMYHAQVLGSGNYQVFQDNMHTDAMQRLKWENSLRLGVERQEFLLYYQPLVDLKTGEIIGFEALIRWQHPEEGLVSPLKFISIAEETGLIIPLGEWVLQTACRQLKKWQIAFPQRSLMISVNLSGKQFSQKHLVQRVQNILSISGIDPQDLKLEITESVVMQDVDAAIDILEQLKALDIKLGIDDFGTGYSSLSYLNRFPTNTLKVDKSFVGKMEVIANGTNMAIVKTIITLAHVLGMDVIAEGIETAEQLNKLKILGCEHGQGYFFAKPLPVEQATALLADQPAWLAREYNIVEK